MTKEVLYRTLKLAFCEILDKYDIRNKTAQVGLSGLQEDAYTAELRAEVTLTAKYEGSTGECSTTRPGRFSGTLSVISEFDIENDIQKRSIFIAVLNAVMNKLELCDDCVSCDDTEEERCAEMIVRHYRKHNGRVKLLLAGYQPYILKAFCDNFPVRVLDLDPDNIGKTYDNVLVEDGIEAFSDAAWWADAILCTGSALTNGTIINYMNMPKDVIYYGTTIAGCARILQLRRLCPCAGN